MVHCSRKTGKPRSSCAGRFEERGVEPSFGVTATIIRVMGAVGLGFHETYTRIYVAARLAARAHFNNVVAPKSALRASWDSTC